MDKMFETNWTSEKSSEKYLSSHTIFRTFFTTQLLQLWIRIVLKALVLQKISKDSRLKRPGQVESKKLFSWTIMNKIFETNFRFHVK